MDTEKEALVLRVMALGVFQQKDRHTLRTMSVETLREIIKTVNLPQMPVVQGSVFHRSQSDERLDIINGLIASGHFTVDDQNGLWQLSIETLRELATDLPKRADEPIANEMRPPSLGDFIRNGGH